ncbi:class B sortase [Butyrivibrio sp. LC3010]|uniref:class B sortase n=1 Tax=Butyrivibrio sp. LC3010 TaxID=1280680 RepID=UPI00042293F1|nr:class B sortase [Butyrivibrio sp. LC3010]
MNELKKRIITKLALSARNYNENHKKNAKLITYMVLAVIVLINIIFIIPEYILSLLNYILGLIKKGKKLIIIGAIVILGVLGVVVFDRNKEKFIVNRENSGNNEELAALEADSEIEDDLGDSDISNVEVEDNSNESLPDVDQSDETISEDGELSTEEIPDDKEQDKKDQVADKNINSDAQEKELNNTSGNMGNRTTEDTENVGNTDINNDDDSKKDSDTNKSTDINKDTNINKNTEIKKETGINEDNNKSTESESDEGVVNGNDVDDSNDVDHSNDAEIAESSKANNEGGLAKSTKNSNITKANDEEAEDRTADKSNASESDTDWEPCDVDLTSLKDEYPETVGWLFIENTSISYPIMQGSDNEKYLNIGYTGEEANTGAIFLDYRSAEDFNDSNSIIYGHNMKDKSMFGKLRDYRESKEYYNDHQYFQIITPDAEYRYKVFAYMDVPNDSVIYDYTGEEAKAFVADAEPVRIKSYMDSEIPVNKDDKVVILSTCTSQDDLRFVVLGVLVDTKR